MVSNEKSNNENFVLSGYELVHFCELDKYATQSYCAVHGVDESKNLGDITKVDENNLKPFNMICGGSPCFVEGTLVLTDNGYVPIEDIEVGDMVMTHKGNFKKVLCTMINEANELVGVYPSTSEFIFCTPTHPLYIRRVSRKFNPIRRSYDRIFEAPAWINAENAEINSCYIGTVANRIEELPKWNGYVYSANQYDTKVVHKNELSELFEYDDFWYIVGKYIGDGWIRNNGSFTICGNKQKVEEITEALDKLGWNYCIVKEETVYKVQVVKKEMCLYLSQFGKGASNKHLTKDILNLPKDKLMAFLQGYISADGCYTQGKFKITSVSKRLIYDISQCVLKVYNRPFSIYHTQRPDTCTIDGRTVHQKDTYQLVWKPDRKPHDHAFYEDGYSWSPITKMSRESANELVYNLEVEDDNSYVVQNMIVHNCQDFSISGRQEGVKWVCKDCGEEYNPLTVHHSKRDCCPKCGSKNIDKTRSSLLVEWLRIIKANKPIWGIYENVKNIVGKRFKDAFDMFIEELHEYGYNTYWKVLNSKDYGIPQNRERLYLIIILKEFDNGKFEFPKPFDNGIRLKDMLEDEVDEKYYVTSDKATALISQLVYDGKIPE